MNWMRVFVFMLLAYTAVSCTTDFDVTAPYEEVMLAYCILDQQETTHYVRIQKGFLDEKTSALALVSNPDSIYYADILTVTMTEIQTNRSWTLERIRTDTLSQPIAKDSGTFAQMPHYLYRFNANLNQNNTYRLTIENRQTGKVATAETPLVKDFQIVRPFREQKINWLAPSPFFAFWNLPANGRIHDLTMRIHWSIADPANPSVRIGRDFADWRVFFNIDYTEAAPRFEILGDNFYIACSKVIPEDPTVIRYFDSLSFTFNVGSIGFSDYINFNLAQTGITQDFATSQYTNFTGAYGLFASRFSKTITGVDINGDSLDSLACGSRTNGLSFAPSNVPSRYPNYPYCN